MMNFPWNDWDSESPDEISRTGSDSLEIIHHNEQVLSRFYEFKAQAILAIERHDVDRLTAAVSFITGFLAGVRMDEPQPPLNFLRKKKHTIQSLVRDLNMLEDAFMAFRKK